MVDKQSAGIVLLQREMLRIYSAFDALCAQYGIKYYAAYGTALGAVRHRGFIPWDDDFDVEMLRDDFERFLNVARTGLPKDLTLVSWWDTYGYSNLFAKIVLNSEERLHALESGCGCTLGQGVFMDIFPVDGLPNSVGGQMWHLLRRGILKVKERCYFPGSSVSPVVRFLLKGIGLAFRSFYSGVMTKKDFCAQHTKILQESDVMNSKIIHECGWLALTWKAIRSRRPFGIDVYGEPRKIQFEDRLIPVHAKVEDHLDYEFGDYMKLPPVEKRVSSHCGQNHAIVPWRLGRVRLAKRPLLSIVVANYNYGRFLDAAICSVTKQCWGTAWGPDGQNVLVLPSGEGVELIICDAASTDNSVEVIKKHGFELAWWCSEPDGGQSAAFNKGFSHSTGKYLTWLNADDLLIDGVLERVAAKMNQHPDCEWFTGNYFRFIPTGEITQMNWGPHYYPKILQWKSSPITTFGPTSFFSRKIYDEVGGIDERLHYGMDSHLWLCFITRGIKQRRLRLLCWAFRLHAASKTSDFSGHVREKTGKFEDEIIYGTPGFKRPKFPHYVMRIWRMIDGSLLVRFLLSIRFRKAEQLIGR